MTPKPASNFDRHFPPIGLAIGKLVYSWNELHEHLGELFEAIIQPKNFGAALAAWRAVENDRTQRTMLRLAVQANWPKETQQKSDIIWLLEKTHAMAEDRNNVIHSPYAILTEFGTTKIVPLDFFGNPRARKLSAKIDLAHEIEFYFIRAQALSAHAARLATALRDSAITWPNTPDLPERPPKNRVQGRSRRRTPR